MPKFRERETTFSDHIENFISYIPNFNFEMPYFLQVLLNKWIIFSGMIVSYFFCLAGIIYDLINEPPSMGTERDEVTGRYHLVTVMKWRINGQYMIEGFFSAVLVLMSAFGVIFLYYSATKDITKTKRNIFLISGLCMLVIGYNILIYFLKLKVGNYLYYSQ
eukprot:EC826568.1.p1 GENE.EC826568.1~~EC826568.1.p1  ORF type:complete len:169 (+),score=17.56 EC826568.1:24-509(+)